MSTALDERKATCKTCRFWAVEDVRQGMAHGACHRYPPTPLFYEDDIEDRRPYMAHADWCGEWAALAALETKP